MDGLGWHLMRHSVIAILLFCISVPSYSQYGNEWINFNQPYFKIPVAQNGIYKLTYSSLIDAGISSAIDPRTIRIYHRGVEQAIRVEGETDGVLNSTDYIEFYGRRNDGSSDQELYPDPVAQPHQYYNLYSDTTSYFLTLVSGQAKRISVVSEASAGLPVEPFHWDEKLVVLKDQYAVGRDYGNIFLSHFDLGEGWTGTQTLHGQTTTYVIESISNTYTSGPAPTLEILLTGRGSMNHVIEVSAGTRLLGTVTFSGFSSYKHIQNLQWSDISGDGKISINIKVVGQNGFPDRASVGYIKLRYPQQFNIDNQSTKTLVLNENTSGKTYLQLANAPVSTRLFDVTFPENVRQIDATAAGPLNAVVTSTSISRTIFATSVTLTPQIKPALFRQIIPSQHNYIIISHPALRKPASGYIDPVKAYAEYRSLESGGNYDTLIVNIDHLYNQFNYGEQSALAIYRFMKFLYASNPPKYLFIIGKGLDVDYNYFRTPNSFSTYKSFVPSGGMPGSDMAFTAGLSGTPYAAGVATGRLSAVTPQDVASYLNKVKAMEALPFDDLRRKNILHLSGGIYDGEPQLFKSFLQQFALTAKSVYLGGRVMSIAKQSTNQEVINVADELNAGLNLITFFGHSATTATDFDIGNVTDPVLGYNNKDKYPLLLMNGCYAGSIFLNASIFGENWVNTPDKGAIGVIAHSSLGIASLLNNYSSLFYSIAYGDEAFINKGIGDVQKETARRYLEAYGSQPNRISQVQQMVLLGDPAYRLFGAGKPDFEITEEGISVESFNGEPVTAFLDSLKLSVVVKNFGIAKSQNIKVSVTRKFSDGSTEVYDSIFSPIFYSDTIVLKIPGEKEKGFGNNTFTIKIDSEDSFDELNESNNEVSYTYFIPLSRTQNLYPHNFAIVNTPSVNLTFQYTDIFSAKRKFLLEIDTLKSFNSTYKKQLELDADVIATYALSLLADDTLTYYWRTRLKDPVENESHEWDVSSFTHIDSGPEGWAQTHFQQFETNGFNQLVADPEIRRLEFKETVTDIAVRTFGSAAGKPVDSVSVKINGAEYNYYSDAQGVFGCRNNTINFIAFEKQTTQPYPGIYLTWADMLYTYGGKRLICGREPYVINSYLASELIMGNDGDIVKYVDNIPVGDSVLMFNIGDADYTNWPAAAKTKLGELGISAAQLDNLSPGAPVVIFARKGAAVGTAKVITATSGIQNEQRLKINTTVTGRATFGKMKSSVIGPASAWGQFLIRITERESNDVIHFDIYGVKSSGEEQLLRSDETNDTDISFIDATEYPFLRIEFKSEDQTFVTSPQLKRWIVTYEPLAEGLALFSSPNQQQTLQEGQVLSRSFKFVNISSKPFAADSLTVNYDVINSATMVSTKKTKRIKSPSPTDTTKFDLKFSTVAQDGMNNIAVFVNPHLSPEQRYDNNSVLLRNFLKVETDPTAPVLDVLFDQRHIANEEYVSSSPSIDVTLWDDNPYLLKADTTGIKIFLASPCIEDNCVLQPIYFTRDDISWKAATAESEFQIHFTPKNLVDGVHKFRIEATDANGNESGVTPYEILFKVKHEESLVISAPYPNPFQYQATFEFQLTGDELPQQLLLQIFNTRGEIVYEFDETAVEEFHIGTNQLYWNGLNQNQQPIPNGIYVYHFRLAGDHRQVTRSGKLVLIR